LTYFYAPESVCRISSLSSFIFELSRKQQQTRTVWIGHLLSRSNSIQSLSTIRRQNFWIEKQLLIYGQREEIKIGRRYSKNQENVSLVFRKLSKNLSHPFTSHTDRVLTSLWMKGYTMQSLVALTLTGPKCIKNKHSSLYIMKIILTWIGQCFIN
jgi:hypothetical protein